MGKANPIESLPGSDDLCHENWSGQGLEITAFHHSHIPSIIVELDTPCGIWTILNRRYVPVAVVIDYEFLTFPVVVTVAKEWKLDADFFSKRILEAFTELLPETFALNKLVMVVVESDKYFCDVGVELIKLIFCNGTACTIFEATVFFCTRLMGVIHIMRLGCWNVLKIDLTSFSVLDHELIPVIFGLQVFWIYSIWEK